MWSEEKIIEYWQDQTKKGDNPCHYHNKWQDRYAFNTRIKVFKKSDFVEARNVVDIGCGVGDYTVALSKLSGAKFTGFDFPFNIGLAQKKYAGISNVIFVAKSLPDPEVAGAISEADVVLTTTVYVHLASEARKEFIGAVSKMKAGSKVMILEYMPDKVPEFQKSLQYKKVETPSEIIDKFTSHGFKLKEMRHVNFVDSFFFFHLGRNFFSYWATRLVEALLHLIHYKKSKYKLLILEKMA